MKKGYWIKNPEKLEYLLKWYSHFGSSIYREMDLPRKTIRAKSDKLNLKMLPRSERLCFYCRENYVGSQRTYGFRCEQCFSIHRKNYKINQLQKNPLLYRMRDVFRSIKSRNQKRFGRDVDFDVYFLIDLWKKQNGKCFYTGIDLEINDKKHVNNNEKKYNTPSIDRVDNKRCYEMNNIVLCSYWANISKSNLSLETWKHLCESVK